MRLNLESGISFLSEKIDEDYFNKGVVALSATEEVVSIKITFYPPEIGEKSFEISHKEFISVVDQLKKHQFDIEFHRIRIEDKSYYFTEPGNYRSALILSSDKDIRSNYKDVKISISQDNELLFALIILINGLVHPIVGLPEFFSNAFLIIGANGNKQLELQAISALQFELLTTYGIEFEMEKIDLMIWDDDDLEEFESFEERAEKVVNTFKLRESLSFDIGMEMYRTAIEIDDTEFRLLSLYKIIEYYSPIAFRQSALELMRKKLDSPRVLNPDGEFLESIISLVNSLEVKRRDRELIKSVFFNCVDIVDLYEFLPNFLKQKIKNKVTYHTKRSERDKAIGIVSDCLYATRNMVAHAKSNYETSGDECPDEELDDFNYFLIHLAERVIKWYCRLPEYKK